MRKIVYMEWVKLKKPARYEIGGSGVIPVKIDELPEARDTVDINDFNLYGYRPLLAQIAERYEVAPSQVLTTQGTSMANYLAYASVLGPGDEVLVEKPAYEPLLSIPRLLGAKINRFNRTFKNGFRINIDEIAKKLTPRTKLIALTNMHNPCGVLTSNEELSGIGKLARKVGAFVVVDEVYMDFLFEARPKSAVHLGPNFMVTSSLTKVYGLDGLRCGWILASPKQTEIIWRLQDFFGVNGAIPAERASTAAFQNLDRFVERTRAIVKANRPLVDKFMADHKDKLSWVVPDGGPVCFPRMLDRKDTREFAANLKSEYGTTIIPGYFFEMPQHFRLGFGGPTESLKGGLRQLSKALND
ncbi:MAG TPA: aminotransferase class I/II-fold pyridoxal phosphate-dependent enzyme [Blastocatellia bacterium]|nr:aminotransferase class I/II-fold pyridoxal phosphate-dependent enzyme [Blastocatellia bacterium]